MIKVDKNLEPYPRGICKSEKQMRLAKRKSILILKNLIQIFS